jgi:adenine phosphoribosyltransferase
MYRLSNHYTYFTKRTQFSPFLAQNRGFVKKTNPNEPNLPVPMSERSGDPDVVYRGLLSGYRLGNLGKLIHRPVCRSFKEGASPGEGGQTQSEPDLLGLVFCKIVFIIFSVSGRDSPAVVKSGRLIMNEVQFDLEQYIRKIPDWPKKGILFRDITPLLADSKAFAAAVKQLCKDFKNAAVDYVAAVEARGFIFGSAAAVELGAGFIPIRKTGKLPGATESVTYDLEYGQDSLEVHKDSIEKGAKVLMVDDLLATGGTMAASCELIEKIGGKIMGIAFLIELSDLGGRNKLQGYDVHVLMTF